MGGQRLRKPPFGRRRSRTIAPWVLALLSACGRGDTTDAAPKGTTAAASAVPRVSAGSGGGRRGDSGGATRSDGATSAARIAASGGPAPSASAAAGTASPTPDAGPPVPCRVTWEGGPHLRFVPTDAGGSVHVDLDADGVRDLCATFKVMAPQDDVAAGTEHAPSPSAAPIGYLRIDEGCDRKAETIVRVEAAEPGLFRTVTRAGEAVAVASLVPLPFVGSAAPGYVLDRSPGAYSVTSSCGRVVRVRAKAPPATEATFRYAPDPCARGARLSEIRHDEDGDGTPERVLAYRYGPDGRLVEIAETRGTATRTAKVRGTCR